MREKLWLRLRKSALLRKVYEIPALRRLVRETSYLLMPSEGHRVVEVRRGLAEGLLLELNPRWEVFLWEGDYEPEVQTLLPQLLRPDLIFYDVGAGIGLYSCIAARSGAQVFAFEPDERNASWVKLHLRLNGLDSAVKVVKKAVFSYTGEITVHPSRWARGHGCAVVDLAAAPSEPVIPVPCVTLDDFAAQNPAPHLVKIDVEGAESEVLKGAERVFATARPDLLCEVHDEPNRRFIEAWLHAKRYTSRWLEDGEVFPRHLFSSPEGPLTFFLDKPNAIS